MQPAQKLYTHEEYLALEETAATRSEYFQGEILVMAGGTDTHNGIAMNVGTYLNLALVPHFCRVFGSDMKIHIEAANYSTYPDVMVICGEIQYWNNRRDILTNPLLIVEVLSPSTQKFDNLDKFEYYRSLPSFQHYLLISKERLYVEYHRDTGDGWLTHYYNQSEQVVNLQLPLAEIPLTLHQIYQKTGLL